MSAAIFLSNFEQLLSIDDTVTKQTSLKLIAKDKKWFWCIFMTHYIV